MKNISLLALLVLVISCASNKIPKQCQQWNLACYSMAQQMGKQESKMDLALSLFKKGCEANHPQSCADAGYLSDKMGDTKAAKDFSLRSCKFGDELGCYNYACYNCRENNVSETLTYLENSFRLGGSNWEERIKDPDLKCLKQKHFKTIEKWQSQDDNNISLSLDHTFFPMVSSAIIYPRGFNLVSTSPLIFTSPLGATIIHSFDPPMDLKKNHQLLHKSLKKKKKIIYKRFKKNGYDTIFSKYQFTEKKRDFIRISSVTKTPKGNMLSHATFPENMSITFDATISFVIANTIYNPMWEYPEELKSFAKDHLKKFNLSFVGIYNGGYFYAPNGEYEIFKTYPFLKISQTQINKSRFDFAKKEVKKFFEATGNKVKKIEKLKTKSINKGDYFFKIKIYDKLSKQTYTILYALKKSPKDSVYLGLFYYFKEKKDAIDIVELTNGIKLN